MLTSLHVQNLVVVREIEVEFDAGLTVLSGETGAGKSILIEALSLALGERADSQLIRPGAERAVVTASFRLPASAAALALLREHELDDGEDCILRRVLNRDGRSRAYCNSTPVTIAVLRELAGLLVDIHAQHASQRLLQRDVQRALLDGYAEIDAQRAAVRDAWQVWKSAHEALLALERDGADSARLDLMRYQVEELHQARLDEDELATIESDYKKLANSAQNLEICAGLRQLLAADDGGAVGALDTAAAQARRLGRIAPEAANLAAAIEQAGMAAHEALHELDAVEAGLNADPERVIELDQRLAVLHNLARKHHVGLSELGTFAAGLEAELEAFDSRRQNLDLLREQLAGALSAYERCAADLSKARGKAAQKMNADISARMRDLGIPHARFEVAISAANEPTPQPYGRDRVEFHVSTNPDQPPGVINKVASGGELSRITLAIQAATAAHTAVPVAVYDEVDTGIGGNTANIVGRSLRDVARHGQVICITHSPQVASAGDHHLLVDKQINDGRAETTLVHLDNAARETEIARMLGAAKKTRSSIAHARDLLAMARS